MSPATSTTAPALALTDVQGRLIAADQPFLELQLRCGGEVPGGIAVPALREAERTVR